MAYENNSSKESSGDEFCKNFDNWTDGRGEKAFQTPIAGSEKHPYDLCLQEIWVRIFELLTDPNDLSSCLNSCSTFNKLLQDNRVVFMFPEVFKIIATNTNRKKEDHVDMLVCRSVCKSWKHGVDAHYQNLPHFFETDYYAFHEEALKCITAFLCRIWNDPFSADFVLSPRGLPDLKRKLEKWTSALDKISTNPFPSRHFTVYDSEETLRDDVEGLLENLEMKEGILELLTKFGHHVHYFTVLLHMGRTSHRYLMLLEWLKQMSNLKVISLYFRAGDDDFEDTVLEFPFPEISQLTVFQGDKLPNVVMKSVLKANPQIEKLQNQGAPSLTPFKQPNLTQISVQSHLITDTLKMDSAKFSKLEKFSIDFHVAGDKAVEFISWSNYSCKFSNFEDDCFEVQLWNNKSAKNRISIVLFTMLKRFEGTLVHFRMGVSDEPLNDLKNGFYSFGAACIDIILPLKAWSLKTFHMSVKCRDGYRWLDETDALTQLHTYLQGRLVESTIWKLPEVKQVFVVDGCDGYLTIFM